jgi:hypothetical protein
LNLLVTARYLWLGGVAVGFACFLSFCRVLELTSRR